MVKKLLIFICLLFPLLLLAQEKQPIPTRGFAVGLFAQTYGFGFDFRYVVLRSEWDYHFGLSFSSYKNPKEAKIKSAYADQGGKNYVFDKLNYGYVLAPTFGLSRQIIPRKGFNRIGLSGGFSGGPLLSLLKPYYLQIAVPFSGTQAVVETHKYDPQLYNYTNIYGIADYFKGMDEISIIPGARLKTTATVDFSAHSSYIRAVELGIFADIFAKQLPLLGFTPNKQFFLGGSIEVLIGNSW